MRNTAIFLMVGAAIISLAVISKQTLGTAKELDVRSERQGDVLDQIEQQLSSLRPEVKMAAAEAKQFEYMIALQHPEYFTEMDPQPFNLYLDSFEVQPGDEIMIDDPNGGTYPYTVEEIKVMQVRLDRPVAFMRLRRYDDDGRTYASAATVYPDHFIMSLTTPRGTYGVVGTKTESRLINPIEAINDVEDAIHPHTHDHTH